MSSIIAELLNVSWDLMKTLENNKMSLVNTDLLASPDDDDACNMYIQRYFAHLKFYSNLNVKYSKATLQRLFLRIYSFAREVKIKVA